VTISVDSPRLDGATDAADIGSIASGAVLPAAPAMQLFATSIEIETHGPGLYEFTDDVSTFVAKSRVDHGLLTAFCRHTSASLLIQENADGDVKTDLLEFFRRIAPEGMEWIVHRTEGRDDMPAHIKAALTQTSIGIPVVDGEPAFGTWQGIYLFEHRARPHRRTVQLQLIGDS
jgi:secondary thiamine-phosphate synthase enzyme